MMHEWEDDLREIQEIEDFDESMDDPLDAWEEMVETRFAVDTDDHQLEWQMISAIENHDIPGVVELVENAREPISRKMAGRCLVECMKDATLAEYAVLLACLPEGEYAGTSSMDVDWRLPKNNPADSYTVQITGTLVSHAVAWDRQDILGMLMNRGHDVDGTSFSATSAMVSGMRGFGRQWECNLSEVRIFGKMQYPGGGCWGNWAYSSLTPLALAVLLGHEDCARILLEHGAAVGENPGVSRMMNLAWREKDKRYQAARTAVLSYENVLCCRPVLSELTESSRKRFRWVLRRYSYTPEEYAQFFETLLHEMQSSFGQRIVSQHEWEGICGKLIEIGEVCPDALTGEKAMCLIFCCGDMDGFSPEPLMPFLRGRRIDLTEVPWMYPPMQTCRTLLSELSKYCEPVLDRYGLFVPRGAVARLKMLLKYVTVYSGERKEQISNLTKAILHCDNAKLIRHSLEHGIIPESTKDIICWMIENPCSDVCREAVLATHRDKSLVLDNWCGSQQKEEDDFWWMVGTTVMGESAQVSPWLVPFLTGDMEMVKERMSDRQKRDTFGIAGGNRICFHGANSIECTELCAAALEGQDEVIKFLLDEFSLPIEEHHGGHCSIWYQEGMSFLIEPTLAAALGGHWHTVKLLLERGAHLHWDDPWVKELWKKYCDTDLYEEVRFRLGDWAVTM